MITGIILVAVITFIAVASHRRPRLERKVFKRVPLIDWMYLLIVPIILYIGLTLIIRNILSRPRVEIMDFDAFTILSIGILFLTYGFVGTSIHFVGKVLSRYIPRRSHSLSYQVNEIFHGKLGHYLAYVGGIMVLFLLGILEINYPLMQPVSGAMTRVIALSGGLFGLSSTKMIFYTNEWFGGYNKPLFFMVGFMFIILLGLFSAYMLHIGYYPVNMFMLSVFFSMMVTFLVRQLFIFTRLNAKRRLRFLAKILSA